jgi:hypothetical protein
MDASIFGDLAGKRICVDRFQLIDLAVFDDQSRQLIGERRFGEFILNSLPATS